jgi:sortase A
MRLLGTLLVVAGSLTLVWAVLVWQWMDPFTALYTKWKQHQLAAQYDKRAAAFRPPSGVGSTLAAEQRAVAREAFAYRHEVTRGEAIGRIKIPRLGLDMVLVNGTDHETLKKGPGRYLGSYMPGEHELVYIAGHRTTYLAPFAHIDSLRLGDRVTFELPYATFLYEIRWHDIVPADDVDRLSSHHREVLALQACHPRFFASHRYIAYAILIRVEPKGGRPYTLIHSRLAPTTSA